MRGLSAVQCADLSAFESAEDKRTLQRGPAPGNFQASRLATLADDSLTSIMSLTLDKVSLFLPSPRIQISNDAECGKSSATV